MFPEASPAEKVLLHDWDVLWFRIPLGAWQWKPEAPSPKWETLSKARFWTAMGILIQSMGHQWTLVACVHD